MQTQDTLNSLSLHSNKPNPNKGGAQGKITNGAPLSECLNSKKQ